MGGSMDSVSTQELRRELHAILASIDDPGRAVVLRAENVAGRLHADDSRSDGPYVNHLLRVTIRIARSYHVFDIDVLSAALLHDAVEDHPGEISHEVLSRDFSPRMARLVRAVTNPRDFDLPEAEWRELYRAHVVASLGDEPWARIIKLSDFADNAGHVMDTVTDPARREYLRAKYLPLIPDLVDFATREDTPLDFVARRTVLQTLNQVKTDLDAAG
jgi:(p)ppGpp synthase/HD superfamily hydrolase